MSDPRVNLRTRLAASELLAESGNDFEGGEVESGTISKICATCLEPFELNQVDQAWWLDHGLRLPRTCGACRAAMRAERKAAGTYTKPFTRRDTNHD
ncbi:MAG: hypothetical protein ABJA98_12440 [Acidobacteriota bacterium]